MSRRPVLAPLLMAALVSGTGGCGSNRAATKTPRTGTALPTVRVPATSGSAPISSPGFRSALIHQLAKHRQIPAKFDAPWADCVIKRLKSDGFKTVADARAHPAQLRAAGTTCARHVILGLH